MPAFNRETDSARLDYRLMIRSPVRLLHSRDLLADIVAWLRDAGYELVEVDASWLATVHMFRDIGNAVGYNCHDQWQCLHEGVAERIWEASGRATGFVLVLTGFDVFANAHIDDARALLGTIAGPCWSSMGGRTPSDVPGADERSEFGAGSSRCLAVIPQRLGTSRCEVDLQRATCGYSTCGLGAGALPGSAAPGGPHGSAASGRIRRMRRLMVLLLVMAVAGCGDGDATETGATEQFTQGGVSMEPTVRAGQVITARTVTGTYEPRRGDVVLFRSPRRPLG